MTQVVERPAPHRAAARGSRLHARLGYLFPDAPQAPLSWRGVALAAAAVAVGTLVGVLRVPGAGALNTVWGEDGAVFLSQRTRLGFWHSLTTSYAGYFHLVPRLLTEVTAELPAAWAAAAFAVESSLVTALLAVFVYVASGAHLRSRLSRALVAAVAVAVPVAAEIADSVANFHWVGLYAVFWALLWAPKRRLGQAVAVAVVLLVAGSDILVALFAPVLLLRLVRRPDRQSFALAGALALGVAVQVCGLLFGSSSRPLKDGGPAQVGYGYARHVVPDTFFGEGFAGDAWRGAHWPLWVLLGGVALALVAVVGWRSPTANWTLASVAALYSGIMLAVPTGLDSFTLRYAAVPVMLLTAAVAAVLQERLPKYLITVVFLVAWCSSLRTTDNPRHLGPTWSGALRQARVACQADPTATVTLPIAPVGRPVVGYATLPCDYLRH